MSQDSREAHIHSFNSIRNIDQILSFLSKNFNIVARSRVIRNIGDSGKPIETVSDCDVESLAEYSVSVFTIGNDLSIASADIKHSGVAYLGYCSSHFDVADAMVHPDDGDVV